MKKLGARFRSLLLALAACACTSGTETGNPPTEHTITIMALSREAPTQALALDEGWLSLRRLALVPCAADAGTVSTYDFPIELFRDPPQSVTFETSVPDYCGVRAQIGPWPGATPAELSGLSAFVSGVRSDDLPFELRSTFAATLDFTSPSGALDSSHLVLGVLPEPWFADADVHGAATSPDGVAVVDGEHNAEVLAAFDAATPLAISLYADADGDGVLSGDEHMPVATASH